MPSRLSLLIVDDTEAEREILTHTLHAAFPGAEIREASHPSQVGRMCEDEDFSCVLVDYNMPEVDGVTLASELRLAHAYLPIILVTSVGDEMLVAEALRCGVSDYIPKSRITTDSIRRTVSRSIDDCAQAQLIHAQREDLENFAFALAHDFKQPIRQIITFSQLIGASLGPEATGDTPQHLTFLSSAAGRLGRLVDVMLQYTLLNEPPELSDIDLSGVLDGVRTSLGPYLTEHDAEFITPAQTPMVHGNEALLIQILQNLVINGVRYNHSPTPRVELTVRRRHRTWIVQVSDNGIGIEAEYLTDIFKPLLRLHTATEYPGSGLGLTLARKAVAAQKGAIWCESMPGRGSVFHVQLRAAQARVGA
jgi:signal transduction histidine kinase